jgi:hypothetical protein
MGGVIQCINLHRRPFDALLAEALAPDERELEAAK